MKHRLKEPRTIQCKSCPALVVSRSYSGIVLCRDCSRKRRTESHRAYYFAHKKEIDEKARLLKQSPEYRAKDRYLHLERYHRNQEVLKKALLNLVVSLGLDDLAFVSQQHLQNPQFIFVDPKGRKHRENLFSPLPDFADPFVDLRNVMSA